MYDTVLILPQCRATQIQNCEPRRSEDSQSHCRRSILNAPFDEMTLAMTELIAKNINDPSIKDWLFIYTHNIAHCYVMMEVEIDNGTTYKGQLYGGHMLIIDCDEPMNYWEPTHYLMYGHGLQTWEYSPVYALRSYCYLLIHSVTGKLFLEPLSQNNKVVLFYLIKIFIGLNSAFAQTIFIRGVNNRFGNKISLLTTLFMLCNPGLFLSTTTYLPTTFSMITIMFGYGFWMLNRPLLSVFSCAVSVFLGWPFVIVLCVPIALDLLYRRGIVKLLLWAIIPTVSVLLPMMAIDKQYYGKTVLAIWNIIAYNFTSSHAGGSQLYGIEHWTFYFINCFVNFNIVFLLSMLTIPLYFLLLLFKSNYLGTLNNLPRVLTLLIVSPYYIWFAFMTYLPHKEERFLFVIYPFICLTAAITIYLVINILKQLFLNDSYSHKKSDDNNQQVDSGFKRFIRSLNLFLQVMVVVLFFGLSASRIFSTYRNYTGAIDTYTYLYDHELRRGDTTEPLFPKFAFNKLDNNTVNSNFKGHLPKPFTGTSNIPSNMNDRNQEELDRYLDVSRCHYIIDFDYPSQQEPHYTVDPSFTPIFTTPFLDASQSSSLARAFYIPFYSDNKSKINK
ncbi:glycosyltransferase [Heterostelium album PN500]|uniref:Mannosyltransferase n=1 Tax=Heterostelium pallidum (strain ATCC 26659 / Pp 5 / PN500) TaxID=670386 RepID=D3B2U7_HETP5|nr:glycosyltransferase [Heterostelium album PN500]EFA83645.1 glycosyltransferase [Heterostelium album PN500]|eukprot:XP_020435762.1 glycosyltransferase [Heterostelium album PN500]